MKWLQYKTSLPGIVFYTYSFDRDFMELNLGSHGKLIYVNIVLELFFSKLLDNKNIIDLESFLCNILSNSRLFYITFLSNLVYGNLENMIMKTKLLFFYLKYYNK